MMSALLNEAEVGQRARDLARGGDHAAAARLLAEALPDLGYPAGLACDLFDALRATGDRKALTAAAWRVVRNSAEPQRRAVEAGRRMPVGGPETQALLRAAAVVAPDNAYAVAGLWKGRFREWMAPALPWTFFGVMVLGIGILMGGAWAYEALSFGGFWAWDPVENASLVPWLTLVAAGHLMLVNKRKETSLYTTLLLTLLTLVSPSTIRRTAGPNLVWMDSNVTYSVSSTVS